jgi:hypothetical protein
VSAEARQLIKEARASLRGHNRAEAIAREEAERQARLKAVRIEAERQRKVEEQQRAKRAKADKEARRLEAERRAVAKAAQREERLRQFRARHVRRSPREAFA